MRPLDYTSHSELYAYELRRLRIAQGFSKSRFAMMVGVSRRYLIKLEAAEASPTLEMMETLAAGLDVTACEMVDFEAIDLRHRTIRGLASPGVPDYTQEYQS